MDGGLYDELDDATFLYELFRATDEAAASRNPNPTPTPTPVPAPIPTYDPFAATPVSYLPASSVSYLPAASHPSPALRFSPPREISQRLAPEVGAKRNREARELERLKRELNRVSKQMNELKNECSELRKDRTMKGLQIKAKELEIQNLKKAKVSSKHVFSAGMDIARSFHGPANGALHAGGSSRTSTRRIDRMNDKDKDAHSLPDDLYLKQGRQTDLPESLELRQRTRVDNGTSTSGVVSLEDNSHFEPRSATCKEIKAIGVHIDNNRSDNEHLECRRILGGPDSILEGTGCVRSMLRSKLGETTK